MDTDSTLREQLLHLLQGGNFHMDFDHAVAEFPIEYVNHRPPHVDYTPWHLLEHMRIAQWDILEFVRNPAHVSPPWPDGYWPSPEEQADAVKWAQTIRAFRAGREALEAMIMDPAVQLTVPLPHVPDYTILREILLVADHNAYHLGEFAILRQVMGTWSR